MPSTNAHHTNQRENRRNAARPEEAIPRILFDAQGHAAYASDSFCDIAGMSLTAIKGKDVTEIFSFADPASAEKIRPLQPGSRKTAHKTVPTSENGGTIPANSFSFQWITLSGEENYLLASSSEQSQDAPVIPEREVMHLLEQHVKASRNKVANRGKTSSPKIDTRSGDQELRNFLNISHDLMCISDTDGKFLRVNDTFNISLGYGDAELRSKRFIDIVHPEDRAQVRSFLQTILQDETVVEHPIDFECRIIGKADIIHCMEWRIKRTQDRLYSVGHDITAIKQHEQELQRREQQLLEAEAIGRMGHWRWIVGAQEINWSEEIYRIFGVRRGEFSPTLDSANELLHRRDLGRMLQAFQRAIIEGNDYELEFRVQQPGGELRYVRCEGRCERDPDGEIVALYGIMQDITEQKIYQQNLEKAKETAERAYAAKSQFLANMSHELRTPLNAIIGFSEMMQSQLLGPINNDRYLDYINGIQESGHHLLELINDILDMSKIEAGKYELFIEDINPAKIIQTVTHMMQGRAEDSDIEIETVITNEDMNILADRRAVLQILLNLVSNSVKFTEPGGKVRIESLEREDYICIKVQDNGIGIPANKLKSITQPFEQASSHETRDHEGSGLGLAISKELTELHGGTLHIDSTMGTGTCVTVRLPYDATRKRIN